MSDEPDDIEDEILRRRANGQRLDDISADMLVPITRVREVIERFGMRTPRPPKPGQVAVPVRVWEPVEPPVLAPDGVKAAPADIRLERLLFDGDNSKKDRTRRLADRIRTEVDTLRALIAAERHQAALEARLAQARREIQDVTAELREARGR